MYYQYCWMKDYIRAKSNVTRINYFVAKFEKIFGKQIVITKYCPKNPSLLLTPLCKQSFRNQMDDDSNHKIMNMIIS